MSHATNEFNPLLSGPRDKKELEINFALPDKHVPDVERANQTLQEIFHAGYYHFSFKVIPLLMIRQLVLQ